MQELVKNTVDGASEKPKQTRNTPTHDQIICATRLLTENGKVIENVAGARCYSYLDGWSDRRVRDAVGEPMTAGKVAVMRINHFGALQDELPAETDPGNVNKLKAEAARDEIDRDREMQNKRILELEKIVTSHKRTLDAILTVIKLPVQTRLEV